MHKQQENLDEINTVRKGLLDIQIKALSGDDVDVTPMVQALQQRFVSIAKQVGSTLCLSSLDEFDNVKQWFQENVNKIASIRKEIIRHYANKLKQSKNDSLTRSQTDKEVPQQTTLASSQKSVPSPPKNSTKPSQQRQANKQDAATPQKDESVLQQNSYIHDEPQHDDYIQQEAEIHKQNLAALREQVHDGTIYMLNARFAYEQARLDWELLHVKTQDKDELIRIFAMQQQAYNEELQGLETKSKYYQDETDAVIQQMQQAWSSEQEAHYPSTNADETEEQVADELQNMYNILSTTVDTKKDSAHLPAMTNNSQHSEMPKLNISNIPPDSEEDQRLQKMTAAERVKYLKEKEMARLHAIEAEDDEGTYEPATMQDYAEEEYETTEQHDEHGDENEDKEDTEEQHDEPEQAHTDEQQQDEYDIDQLEPEDILAEEPPQQYQEEVFFASDIVNSPKYNTAPKNTQQAPALLSPANQDSPQAPSQSLYAKIQERLNNSMKKQEAKIVPQRQTPMVRVPEQDLMEPTPSIHAIIPSRDVIVPQRPKKRKKAEEPKEQKRQKRHNIDPQTAQKLALERAKAAQKRLKEEKEKRELEQIEKSKKLEELEEKRQLIAQAAVAKKAMEEMLNSQILSPPKVVNTSVEIMEREAEAKHRLEEDRKKAAQRAADAKRKLEKLKHEEEEKKQLKEKEKWEERDKRMEAFRQRRIMEDHLKEELLKRKQEELKPKKETKVKVEKIPTPAPVPPPASIEQVAEEPQVRAEPTPRPKTAPKSIRHKTPPSQQQVKKKPTSSNQTPPLSSTMALNNKPKQSDTPVEVLLPKAKPKKTKQQPSVPMLLNPSIPAADFPPMIPPEPSPSNYAGYRMFTTVQTDMSPPNFSRTKSSLPADLPNQFHDLHDISISPPPPDIPMFKEELADKPPTNMEAPKMQKGNRFGWKAPKN